MGSPWKAIADSSRRQMPLMLKDDERTPSEISRHFEFTLSAMSTHLRILRDAGLVSERKEGRHRFYNVKRDTMSEMVQVFDLFWDDRLRSLKEYVENKEKKENEQ